MSESLTLTVAQVADALSVSRWCIYDRIRRGEIPVVHVGRRAVVPRVWLDELLTNAMSQEASS